MKRSMLEDHCSDLSRLSSIRVERVWVAPDTITELVFVVVVVVVIDDDGSIRSLSIHHRSVRDQGVTMSHTVCFFFSVNVLIAVVKPFVFGDFGD